MKRAALYIVLTGLISIVPLVILYADYHHKLRKNSYDFQRKIDYNIGDIKRFDLRYNSYYFAGASGTDLYLGNYTTRPQLLKISPLLTDTQLQVIHIDKNYVNKGDSYTLNVDANQFYLFNGVGRSVLHGNTDDWKAKATAIFTPYFQQGVAISDNSMVFQYVNANTKSNSLRKESKLHKTIENEKALEKQVDGLFCTTGILTYNHQLQQLTYLYAYRNQILLMDTNLNLVKKIKTIDPIDRARFKVSAISSNHSKVITSPALLVNVQCAQWKKYLFVLSRLMGKHEDGVLFKNSTVLDIYDLEKYTYLYSLYLPNQDEKPVSQFRVMDKYIYTLSDHFMTRYTVRLPKD